MRGGKGLIKMVKKIPFMNNEVTVLDNGVFSRKMINIYIMMPTIYTLCLIAFGFFNDNGKNYWIHISEGLARHIVEFVPGMNKRVYDISNSIYKDRADMLTNAYAFTAIWMFFGIFVLVVPLVSKFKGNKMRLTKSLPIADLCVLYIIGFGVYYVINDFRGNPWNSEDKLSRLLSYHKNDLGLILDIFITSVWLSLLFLLIFSTISGIIIKKSSNK